MKSVPHPIPPEALETDIAVLGKKGKGKTYAAKGIVERLLDMGRRVCVLDPLSTWWGLRSGADGESPGYPIAVFGGKHGDMPLTEAMARPLARVIAHENLPAVLDLGEMRKAEIIRFATGFLDELYAENRDPLWLVLEEADLLAPQNPQGDTAAVLGEVDRIARRGRAFGFRLITITQRPARLHKDVLTQLSTLVALGVSSPQDRDALKAWVEGNADRDKAKEVYDTLAALGTGEAWVWIPDLGMLERTKFPPIRTLDTSSTPKAGQKRVEPKRLAEVDLTDVRAALEAPKEEKPAKGAAVEYRTDPAELEAQRREAWEAGYEEGVEEGRKAGTAEAIAAALNRARDAWQAHVAELEAMLGGLSPAEAPAVPTSGAKQEPAALIRATSPEGAGQKRPGSEKVAEGPANHPAGSARQRILDAIATWNTLRIAQPTRVQVAFVASYSPRSSGFEKQLSTAKRDGLIDFPSGGRVVLTEAGRDSAEIIAGSLDLVRSRVLQLLKPVSRRVLEPLIEAYPAALTRAVLAARSGYSDRSSGFEKTVSGLSSLDLVVYPSPGLVLAADWMFGEG